VALAKDPQIASLTELSIQTLRDRRYGSQIKIEERVTSVAYKYFMASYESAVLRCSQNQPLFFSTIVFAKLKIS